MGRVVGRVVGQVVGQSGGTGSAGARSETEQAPVAAMAPGAAAKLAARLRDVVSRSMGSLGSGLMGILSRKKGRNTDGSTISQHRHD